MVLRDETFESCLFDWLLGTKADKRSRRGKSPPVGALKKKKDAKSDDGKKGKEEKKDEKKDKKDEKKSDSK